MKRKADIIPNKVVCEHSFINKSSLQKHVDTIHKKLKPCQCEKCKMCFSHKGGLSSHDKAVHLKSKPFSCKYCQASFARKNYLEKHVKRIHTFEDKTSTKIDLHKI